MTDMSGTVDFRTGEANGNSEQGIANALAEIRSYIAKRDYDKAFELVEGLVAIVESADIPKEDQNCEYHSFGEPFEEVLYKYLYKPQKELKQSKVDMASIYYLYGSLLIEKNRLDEAQKALAAARRWDPVSTSIVFEYLEVLNRKKEFEEFFRQTLDAFKIAFRPKAVARCYRNLGYYFIEKQLYTEAVICYKLSMQYEPDSMQAQSEMHYIVMTSNGKLRAPVDEDYRRIEAQYGVPLSADKNIINTADALGKLAEIKGDLGLAGYYNMIIFGLTGDEAVRRKLEEISAKLRG